MTRLLHSCPTLSRSSGGIFEAVRQLTEAQVDQGRMRISAIGIADTAFENDRTAWEHCHALPYQTVGPRKIGWSREIAPLYRHFRPEIVHLHGLWQYHGVFNKRYCHRHRIPYLVSPHGMLDPWALKVSRNKKRVWWTLSERDHLRSAHCLHALCTEEALAICNLGIKTPVVVIPNGVNAAVRSPLAPPWKDQLGDERRTILFLGRLHPKKGLDNLLDAWDECVRENRTFSQNWSLAIAGWGDEEYTGKLSARIDALGLNGSVAMIGSVFGDQKSAALTHSAGFILPSYSEGLPMAVLEAWAYSLPVLMTEFCNLKVGFDRQAALQITTDASNIAQKLREFSSLTDAERHTIGQNGLLLSQTEFSWSQIAIQFERVYQWLLGGNAPEGLLFKR